MIELMNPLIAALREELQQYGEMLSLLDRQQQSVVARASDQVFESIATVQGQAAVIQAARSHREDHRQAVARHLGLAADTEFGTLIPRLPVDYQPLLQALVAENNQLLARVQQRARQNHLLLARSLELMQSFIGTLFPGRETLVYDDLGHRQPRALQVSALYEAVG